MERLKLSEPISSIVLEASPSALREMANRLDAKAKKIGAGASVIMTISNSITILYNVPINDEMVLAPAQQTSSPISCQ